MGEPAIKFRQDDVIPVCNHLGDSSKDIEPSDSDVFQLGPNCIKLYHIEARVSRIYGRIQHLLSIYEGRIKMENSLPVSIFLEKARNNTTDVVNYVRFRCLSYLPQEIPIPEYAQTGVTMAVQIPFIEGKTLHDIYWEVVTNRGVRNSIFKNGLMQKIQAFYAELGVNLTHTTARSNQLAGINIKPIGYCRETEELELVITDIAADIKLFVMNNTHLLQ